MSDNIDNSNFDKHPQGMESGNDGHHSPHHEHEMASGHDSADTGSGDILGDGNLALDGQDLNGMDNGALYNLSFTTNAPLETMNNFSVIWNGQPASVNGSVISDPVNGDMHRYNVTLTGGSGDGSDRIEFSGVDGNSVTVDNATVEPVSGSGDSANETIDGGPDDDVIYAGDGNDTVHGGDGNDVVYGDSATDQQSRGGSGGDGDDSAEQVTTTSGDSGEDGNSAAETQGGDSGGETQTTDAEAEGASNDTPDTSDTTDGDGGGGSTAETQDGGSGGGGSGDDGSAGDGTGGGGSGDGGDDGDACDLTEGTGPNGDTIVGGNGADTIYGMSGQDYLSGGNGDDTVFGGTGDDHILGGAGNDTLDGGDGNDCIEGGTGDDTITTGAGADHVNGGDDRDTIFGNGGDTVDGGSGGDDHDTLVVQDVNHIEYTSDDGEDGIVHFNDGNTLEFEDIEEIVPCFTPGSIILTSVGEKRVEDLQLGDKIVTRDNGVQEIRWIGTKRVDGRRMLESPHLRPVLIRKGALGKGLPERDMTVSPNHRMLVANEKTTLLFEEREVLVAAKHLINMSGIQQIDSVGVAYIHMMFDEHEVILSDGAWTESFQPGDYSLKGVGAAQRNEIFELFPELRESHGRKNYVAARRSLKRKEAQLLH